MTTTPECKHCSAPMYRKLNTAFHRPATPDGSLAKLWWEWACPNHHVTSDLDNGGWVPAAQKL